MRKNQYCWECVYSRRSSDFRQKSHLLLTLSWLSNSSDQWDTCLLYHRHKSEICGLSHFYCSNPLLPFWSTSLHLVITRNYCISTHCIVDLHISIIVTRITGISQAVLRKEQPLSSVLPQFLQWVTLATAEVSDATSITHFPGIALILIINYYCLTNIVSVSCNGFSYDFPILISQVKSWEIRLFTFQMNNMHF